MSDSCTWIGVDSLVVSEQYQMREKLDAKIIAEYAAMVTDGNGWPFADPVKCIQVGNETFLVDGFHRVKAVQKANEEQVFAVITNGSRTDALKAALSANISHGLRRSNADKRHAIEIALADKTLQKWSDSKLAELCGVSQPFVGQIRGEAITVIGSPPDSTRTDTNGASRPATPAESAPAAQLQESAP